MDRGLYAAASGGLHSARRLDIVANNLANVTTPGFKAQRLRTRQQEFSDTLAATMPQGAKHQGDLERVPGVVHDGVFTDWTPGPVEVTGNPLNVALTDPKQFFAVITPEGIEYTRAGNFTLNSDNELVTPDGMKVSGGGSSIQIPPGAPAKIMENGTVVQRSLNGSISTTASVATLQIVKIEDPTQLERSAGTRFKLKFGQAQSVEQPRVVTESVEMANVNVVDAMIDMINAQKAFEAYTKTARTFDEMNDRSIRNARISG